VELHPPPEQHVRHGTIALLAVLELLTQEAPTRSICAFAAVLVPPNEMIEPEFVVIAELLAVLVLLK